MIIYNNYIYLKHDLIFLAMFRFNIKSLAHGGFKLNVWDIGGQNSVRPYWRNYYQSAEAIVSATEVFMLILQYYVCIPYTIYHICIRYLLLLSCRIFTLNLSIFEFFFTTEASFSCTRQTLK